MKVYLHKFVLIAIFHLTLLAAVAATADKEITIDTVLDKYIKAVGGKEAWSKVKSRTAKGQMSFPRATTEWSSQAKVPNKKLTRMASDKTGVYLNGCDGITVWSSSRNGIQTKTGKELERSLIEADFYHDIRLKELYPNLSFKGVENIDGEEVYTLESKTPNYGTENFSFSKKNGLLVKVRGELKRADGTELQVEVRFSDYRVFDGINYPHILRTKITPRGQPVIEMELKIKEIKHNEKIEDSVFTKPTE